MAKNSIHVTIFGNAKPLTRSLGKAQKAVSGFGKSVSKVSGAAGKVFGGLAVAAGLAVVAGGKLFLNFNQAMTKSVSIMSGVTAKMRKDMENTARSIAKSSTFGATEAADAYFFLASAGLDAAESMAALPKVTNFAQAGAFDLALATDLLTDAQSALGLRVDDTAQNLANMVRVSDVLVKANTLANGSVQQFSEALTNKAGPALKAVGKDVEEGVAVLAVFADQGIKGAEAGTALGIVMRDLQTKAIANKGAWEEMGVAAFDNNGEMRNMGVIIGDLEGALVGMSDEQQKVSLAQLGFSDKSVGYIQALLGQSKAIMEYEESLRSAGGTTQEIADNQLKSFANQLQINIIAPMKDAAITIGSVLVPRLLGLGTAVGKVAEFVTDFAAGLGVVIGWLADIPGPLAKVGLAVAALGVVLLAVSANPIMLGLAAVAAAVAFIGSSSRDAKAKVELFTDDLAGLGDVSFDSLTEIFGEAALADLKEAGVNLADLQLAITGTDEDAQAFSDTLFQMAQSNNDLRGAQRDVEKGLWSAREAWLAAQEAVAEMAREDLRARTDAISHKDALMEQLRAVEGLDDGAGRLVPVLFNLGKTQEQVAASGRAAAEAILEEKDAAARAADPMFDLFAALQDVNEAQDELNGLIEAGKEDTPEFTAAIFDLAKKTADLDVAQADVAVNLDESTGAFRRQLEAIGVNEEGIGKLMRMIQGYNDLTVDVKTFLFQVAGGFPGKVVVTGEGTVREIFHGGGVVGEPKSGEVDTRLLKGETVRTGPQEKALAENLATPTVVEDGGVVGGVEAVLLRLEKMLSTPINLGGAVPAATLQQPSQSQLPPIHLTFNISDKNTVADIQTALVVNGVTDLVDLGRVQ